VDPQLQNEQIAPIGDVLKRADIGEGLLVREGAALFIVESHGMRVGAWDEGICLRCHPCPRPDNSESR